MEQTARFPGAMVSATMPGSDPESIPDDAELVRAAAGGSQAAFGKLYARYAKVVHGILLARVPCGEAEDLVQEVFVTAFRKI